MSNLKPGDIVKNIISVRSNPAVNESRGWSPIEAGTVGIVLAVRQTDLNAEYRRSGKGDVYVDVLMSTPNGPWKAGNYMQGFLRSLQTHNGYRGQYEKHVRFRDRRKVY